MRRRVLSIAVLGLLVLPGVASAARRCNSAQPWCDRTLSPDVRAQRLLSAMTLDEKISLMAGDEGTGVATASATAHTGTSDGVPRLGIPTVYYSDGPVGPRQGTATAMPSPMSQAAAFDPSLAFQIARTIGDEVRKKGNDIIHAPTVDIMRTPLAGRTFETYGEDPFLTSRIAVAWVNGIQHQGVIANVKHFVPNSQEGAPPGAPPLSGLDGGRTFIDARVDDRTLHEIYFPAFEAAVREAHAGTIMCAYNLLNGTPSCENPDLLQRVLRREWGFRGFVLSDYVAAVKSTVQSANAGLSVEFPVPLFYSPLLLSAAVAGGPISASTIDARVGEILRTMFAYGLFDRDAYPINDPAIDANAHAAVAQRAAEQGTVLLRNQGGALPLDAAKLKSIAVIGGPGDRYQNGGGSSAVKPLRLTTPLDGIMQRAGRGVDVRYDPADDIPGAAAAAHAANVAIVFAADSATEGIDRSCLSLSCPNDGGPNQDALIDAVLAANPRTIVVLEDSGPTLAPWADRVPAILQAWYPGEAGGKAIARILFGDVDPGGRLPATFPARDGDWPTAGNRDQYPGNDLKAAYSEKLLVGYRHYDAKRIAPRWPFGFGLSYTTFSMTSVALKRGGIARAAATVDVDVRNTGARAGEEVVQLYLGLPSTAAVPQPPKKLAAFRKVALAPGERRRVHLRILLRSLQSWDAGSRTWRLVAGCHHVLVGRSSRDLPLEGTLAVGGASCGKGVPAART